RLVREVDRHTEVEGAAEERAEGDIAPAEVRGGGHEAIAPPDHADDPDADPDQGGTDRGQECQPPGQVAQVRHDLVDREMAARSVNADVLDGLPAEADEGNGERVDRDLEGEDHDGGRPGPDERRWPAGQ